MYYRLEHEIFVELAASQTFASTAIGQQILPDSFLPHIDAIEADFDRPLRFKEISSLVPHPLVDVIAIGTLQALQSSHVVNAVRRCLELFKLFPKNEWTFVVFHSIPRLAVM